MAGQTQKPRIPRSAPAFRGDEALLEAAQEVFCARRLAAEAEQRGESTSAAVRARRAQAADRCRQWHRALGTSLKHSLLAQRLQHRRLNRTEREVLVALVLSQLGLLPDEIHTCGDLTALFRHSGRATLAALRSLGQGGRLFRSGLVLVENEEDDVRQWSVSVHPELVESLILRGRRRAAWCDVASEEELQERLDKLSRALAAKREAMEHGDSPYVSLSRATLATHKVVRLLDDLYRTFQQHPGWKLAGMAKRWRWGSEWTMILALLGKWLGHLPADDPLFSGGGLARAAADSPDDVRLVLRLLMPDRGLVREGVVRPCGGDAELASGRPEALEHVEFELTEATIRCLGLKRRARTAHEGEFQAREPRLRMEQLVFSPAVRQALELALAHARHAPRLFDEWGLAQTVSYGRSPVLLFSGPPGVGKTAAAEALASALGKSLLVADYSRIQNCFVGQTEKNIVRAFREARNQDAVLFWDEADAMFYSRDSAYRTWEVRDVNVLLQELERFEGVCILATNRSAALDPALERRIAIKVAFERPDQAQRRAIWEKLLPEKLPLAKDVNLDQLSRVDLVGGEIKNVVLNAARLTLQRAEHGPVAMADFRKAIQMEQEGKWKSEGRSRIGFRP